MSLPQSITRPDLSKRYWLFVMRLHDGRCGMNDLESTHDDIATAIASCPPMRHSGVTAHIFDMEARQIVACIVLGDEKLDEYEHPLARHPDWWILRDHPEWLDRTSWQGDAALYA